MKNTEDASLTALLINYCIEKFKSIDTEYQEPLWIDSVRMWFRKNKFSFLVKSQILFNFFSTKNTDKGGKYTFQV